MADNGNQVPLAAHLQLGYGKPIFFIAEGDPFDLSLEFHLHMSSLKVSLY